MRVHTNKALPVIRRHFALILGVTEPSTYIKKEGIHGKAMYTS